MSGSGHGDYPVVRDIQDNNCGELGFNTNLATPIADVIATLQIGDRLTVSTGGDQGPLQAVTLDGSVAGNIVSTHQKNLLTCLLAGHQFVAEVLAIDGAICKVRVYAS